MLSNLFRHRREESETINQVVLGTRWLQADSSIVDERRPMAVRETLVTTREHFHLAYVLSRREPARRQ